MRKIVFGTLLFIACTSAGCTSARLHQSLLMHENRQLEDALYATQAHVAELHRENKWLRQQHSSEFHDSSSRSTSGSWDDDLDFTQPLEMPAVILSDEPDSAEVPGWMTGSQAIPIWSPRR